MTRVARRRPRLGDVVITLALLVIFLVGHVLAEPWPYRAALFPRILSATGILLALVEFAFLALQPPHTAARAGEHQVGDVELITAKEKPDQDLQYVFATAGPRAWAGALGWVVSFFLGLWLVGALVTVPLFAFSYLLVAGNARWYTAALYAILAGGILQLAFHQLLSIPLPNGIFSLI